MITNIKDAKFKVIQNKLDTLIALSMEKGEQAHGESFTRAANGIFQKDNSQAVTYNDINNVRVEIVKAIKDYGVMK